MPTGGGEEGGHGPSPARRALKEQDALWAEVLKLASSVESELITSMQALCIGRADLVAVIKDQRRSIDDWEVRIEQECLRILARYDPTASDLRRMVAVLKIDEDLEQLANLAEHVAKKAKKLAKDPNTMPIPESLKNLSRKVMDSVRNSLGALVKGDANTVRTLIARNPEIERDCHTVRQELKQQIPQEPERSTVWFRMMSVTRNLERIADHASNIARSVIYMKEGTIVRHAEDPAPPGVNRRPLPQPVSRKGCARGSRG